MVGTGGPPSEPVPCHVRSRNPVPPAPSPTPTRTKEELSDQESQKGDTHSRQHFRTLGHLSRVPGGWSQEAGPGCYSGSGLSGSPEGRLQRTSFYKITSTFF